MSDPRGGGSSDEVGGRAGASWADLLLAILPALLYLGIRLPTLGDPLLWLGWDSDAAVHGLMARRMLEGVRFEVFYWGQTYQGPLVALAAAVIGSVTDRLGSEPSVGPLSLRLALQLLTALSLVAFFPGLRRAFGRGSALLALLLMAVGGDSWMRESLRTRGTEMMLLPAAVLFSIGVRELQTSVPFRRWGTRVGFGFVAGLGWWFHNGTAFVTVPVLGLLLLRSETWRRCRPWLEVGPRLRLRPDLVGGRALPPMTRVGAGILLVGAASVLGLVVLRACGLPVPLLFVARPVLEPSAFAVAILLAVELGYGPRPSSGWWRESRRLPGQLGPVPGMVAGFLLAWWPVPVGRLLGWYAAGEATPMGLLEIWQLPRHWWRIATSDLGRVQGWDVAGLGLVAMVTTLVAALLLLARFGAEIRSLLSLESRAWGGRSLVLAVVMVSGLHYLLSNQAFGAQIRYLHLAQVLAMAALIDVLIGRGAGLRRGVGLLVGPLLVTSQLACFLLGSAERVVTVSGEDDPRAVISRIESAGYSICFADYWQAMKLQFLSDERVRFVPNVVMDRNREESRALLAQPERKCWLDRDDRVRSAEEMPRGGAAFLGPRPDTIGRRGGL